MFRLTTFVLLVALTTTLSAQTVEIELSQEAIYGSEDVDLYVRIAGSLRDLGQPELPRVPGVAIRGPGGPQSSTTSINGRVTRETIYFFRLTPQSDEPRTYTIGPVTIPRRGQAALESNRVTLRVTRKPPTGIEIEREVSGTAGATLSPFQLIYTVYYSGKRQDENRRQRGSLFDMDPFDRTNPFGLVGLSLPILKRPEVKVFPIKVLDDRGGKSVGLQDDHEVYIQESSAEKDGFGYRTLVFGFQVVPLRPGPLEIAPAEISMSLITGESEQIVRDVFGRATRRMVPEIKKLSATTPKIVYEVRDPPPQGRPASYNGAVGKYSIDVTASPTEVDAFTPITIEARVRCLKGWRADLKEAILENLSAPLWSREESLTTNFGVSSDVHPGVVEGDVKIFTHTIRPLGAHVKEIPPIPFPYYDADTGKYEVAYSRAIPLTVRAVETVGGGEAIRNTGSSTVQPTTPGGDTPVLSIVEQTGIGANFQTMGRARSSLDPREEIYRGPFIACLCVPPLVFAIALVTRRLRRDPDRVVRDRALARARSRLSRADTSAEQAAAAFQDYFRERLSLGSGELTPGDLTAALTERGVSAELRSSAIALLERFLSARFGGGPVSPAELAAEAQRLLQELDRCLR